MALSLSQKLKNLVGAGTHELIEPLKKEGVWPRGGLQRYVCQGIPKDVLEGFQDSIQSPDDWEREFSEAARRYRGLGDRQADKDPLVASRYYLVSAACAFHAQLVRRGDERREAALRHQCRKAFALAADLLQPRAQRMQFAHEGGYLDVFYRAAAQGARGTVILLNSQQSCKEDMYYFTQPILELGMNTVLIDTPGTGTALPATPYAGVGGLWESIRKGLREIDGAGDVPQMLFGAGVGAAVALHLAARHPTVFRAAVLLSPPYDLRAVEEKLKPWLRSELCAFFGCADDELGQGLGAVACKGVGARVQCPLLIVGGAKDVDFPRKQAKQLAEELGPKRAEYWASGSATHCCYEKQPQLRMRIAQWLGKQVGSFEERNLIDRSDSDW